MWTAKVGKLSLLFSCLLHRRNQPRLYQQQVRSLLPIVFLGPEICLNTKYARTSLPRWRTGSFCFGLPGVWGEVKQCPFDDISVDHQSKTAACNRLSCYPAPLTLCLYAQYLLKRGRYKFILGQVLYRTHQKYFASPALTNAVLTNITPALTIVAAPAISFDTEDNLGLEVVWEVQVRWMGLD